MSQVSIDHCGANHSIVTIGNKRYFFSYKTCVAYDDGEGNRIRRDTNYSVTTAKHMGVMGVRDWKRVSDAEFETRATI